MAGLALERACVECGASLADSYGELVVSASGTVRSSTSGKVNYLLVRDGPMLERWARHLTVHAETKGKRNWLNAHTAEDLERFLEGAARHFEQWLRNETDEDHAAGLLFNVNGAEHVRGQLGLARAR